MRYPAVLCMLVFGGGAVCGSLERSKDPFPSDGSALEFFGVNDALEVTWYHGANSLDQMNEALEGDYQMLEGDIILRWNGFPNQTDEPVMAHPPAYNSDNTLDNWLDSILARADKAPKLDFKGDDVIEPSLKLLQSKASQVNHPVWANADVVRGPNSVSRPIDSQVFLGLVNQYYPAMTLSLGWTTGCCKNPFTRSMMDQMWEIVRDIPQPVTFPARAARPKETWPQFKYLLEKDPARFSITVWTPAGNEEWEGASTFDLLYVRNDCDKRLVYYDLPGPRFEDFRQLCVTAGSALNHFPLPAGRDAMQVTWAHGVNTKAELDEALNGDVMMLEADVTLHGYGTENQTDTPIMAHPPTIYSDQTLEQWLARVVNTSRGIKLDFKYVEVLEPAMAILGRYKGQYNQPVWLNSDIFRGPNNRNTKPVNATEFKRIVLEHFPESTWSIGWTTSQPGGEIYSREMVEEMHEYARDLEQPITFPIRASLVYDSWDNIKWLLDQSRAYTITIWSGSSSWVNPDDLVFVKRNYEIDRVYYDLPAWLMEEVLARLEQTTQAAPPTTAGDTSGANNILAFDWLYLAFVCMLCL